MFHLGVTTEHHLNHFLSIRQEFLPAMIQKMRNLLYVDNQSSGTQALEEVREIYYQSRMIFKNRKLNLHKWKVI